MVRLMNRELETRRAWRAALASVRIDGVREHERLRRGPLRDTTVAADDEVAAIEGRVERLDHLIGRLEARLQHDEVGDEEHVTFLSHGGAYRIRVGTGPCPAVGETLEDEEGRYVVLKLGRAPLPGDRRPCAYLEREGPTGQLTLGLESL
jgi:hypothetical protein